MTPIKKTVTEMQPVTEMRAVTTMQPVEVEKTVGVSVDLTFEEYAYLRTILGRVSGDSSSTLRGHNETLVEKLGGGYSQSSIPSPHELCRRNHNSYQPYYDMFNEDYKGGIQFVDGSKNSRVFSEAVAYYKDNLK